MVQRFRTGADETHGIGIDSVLPGNFAVGVIYSLNALAAFISIAIVGGFAALGFVCALLFLFYQGELLSLLSMISRSQLCVDIQ